MTLEDNARLLSDFGLTQNEAKVYLSAISLGLASVSAIAKTSGVRREDVYRILPQLEKRGLTERISEKPVKIRAATLEDVLSLLIGQEKEASAARLSELEEKKHTLLRHVSTSKTRKATDERPRFDLLLESEALAQCCRRVIRNAQKEIAVAATGDAAVQLLSGYTDTFITAMKRGTRVRVILEAAPSCDEVLGRAREKLLRKFKSGSDLFDVRFSGQPAVHYMIVDNRQAVVATSVGTSLAQTPYMWTDDKGFAQVLQTNFEELWHNASQQE